MRHSGVSRNLQYSWKYIKMSQIYVFAFRQNPRRKCAAIYCGGNFNSLHPFDERCAAQQKERHTRKNFASFYIQFAIYGNGTFLIYGYFPQQIRTAAALP